MCWNSAQCSIVPQSGRRWLDRYTTHRALAFLRAPNLQPSKTGWAVRGGGEMPQCACAADAGLSQLTLDSRPVTELRETQTKPL